MNLNSLPETVRIAIEAAQNKKAAGITILDLREVGGVHLLLCDLYGLQHPAGAGHLQRKSKSSSTSS